MPTTRQELIDYCLRRLGHPVIEINVDEDQIEDRIDDALSYFQDFHFDGTEIKYFKHQITADNIENQSISISDEITGVNRIFPVYGVNSASDGLFNFEYQVRLNDMWNLASTQMSYYYMTKTHMEFINQIINGTVPIRFNRHTDKLYVDWDWSTDAVVGQYIIIECYQKVDPETYTDVFNDKMVKKYATALIKRQWGANLSKFNGIQLPGGVTLNGQEIFDKAEAEIIAIEEEIRNTFEAPPQFYTG